jgi:Animal haem peroxidase
MSGRHSQVIRGLMSAKKSPLFQGRFGRMFRTLPAATFGCNDQENEDNLKRLGAAMSASFDPVKDGKDDEESGIPALYTYLGQFVDHDLTFDPASSLQQENDPDGLTDFRTPAFDLDNVYGRGPSDQPYMYDGNDSFLLGDALNGGDPNAKDLPRNNANPRRALIGDPRNDENTIVSQLQGLFLRFHNRMLADNPTFSFSDVQRLVRFHYQYVVVNDFLPRIVHSSVIADLKSGGRYDRHALRFFHWKEAPFMPVEFSVAAYRLGHSMIRPGYRLNDNVLLPIFPVPSQGLLEGLTGFRAMNTAWGIDWGRFIDTDTRRYDGTPADNARRLQFAYRLDTSLVNPLAGLPPTVASNPSSLAERNLLRGWRLGLPSGQHVARIMGVMPLHDRDILIGKATGTAGDAVAIDDATLNLPDVFRHNCPLWTYILAEAIHFQEDVKIPVRENVTIKTPRLGPVGGRLVAEVFLGLLFGDPHSLLSLDPYWQPASGAGYALKDFVSYALGK